MKTLKDFTPEIQAKIPDYIEKYTKGIFDGSRYNSFNQKDAEELIHWNYEKCGYKKPIVIAAENPYEAQIFFNYIVANKDAFSPILYLIYCLKNKIDTPKLYSKLDSELYNKLRSKLDSELYNKLYSKLDSELYNKLDSELYSKLDSELRSELRSELYNKLRSKLGSELYNKLRSELRSELYNKLRSKLGSELYNKLDSELYSKLDSELYNKLYSKLDSELYNKLDSELYSELDSELRVYNYDYLFTANVWSNGIIAWYKFIKDEFKIDAPINIELEFWNNLYEKSGVYSAIFSEILCIVSKYPKRVHRDNNKELHNLSGVAVEWGNSIDFTKFECNYFHGRNVPEKYFNEIKSKTFTTETLFKEQNEEVKSTCIALMQELHGENYLFRFFEKNLNEVNTYVDKKEEKYLQGTTGGMNVGVYTLFKGVINRESVAYVRCYCPSTDRMFFLGVNPEHNNAKDAIASLYRVPRKLKSQIKYINRQGERFSTVFNCLIKLTKEETEDLVSISGDEYFSKMQYEY